MRKPRVTYITKPIVSLPIGKWLAAIAGTLFKIFEAFLPILPLLMIAGVFFLPEPPHLRWQYEYRQFGAERVYIRCDYISFNSARTTLGDQCPFIAFLERGD